MKNTVLQVLRPMFLFTLFFFFLFFFLGGGNFFFHLLYVRQFVGKTSGCFLVMFWHFFRLLEYFFDICLKIKVFQKIRTFK